MGGLFSLYSKSSFLKWLYKESIFSTLLRFIINIPYFIKWKSLMVWEYLCALPRGLGYNDRRFSALKNFKDKYKGKRLFITCTGPSLTIEDLEKLSGEYVFGMNTICMIHDKTSWQPDFFGIQDEHVFDKIKDYVLNTDNGIVFVPEYLNKLFKLPSDFVLFPVSSAYNTFELTRTHKYFAKFSNNAYRTVFSGFSITYSIMQLAVYMGFDELYLIGADCSYLGQKQHFIEHGNYDPTVAHAAERLIAAYGAAKIFADKNNIRIYNATRGGCLEVFPRVVLEDVLSNNQKNKKSK